MSADGISEYERQRLERMEANHAVLVELGLVPGGSASLSMKKPPPQKKPPRPKPLQQAPTKASRGSRRLRGEVAEHDGIDMEGAFFDDDSAGEDDEMPAKPTGIRFGQARHGHKRLTSVQAAKLDTLYPDEPKELTPEQVQKLDLVLMDLATNRSRGWTSDHTDRKAQGRAVLRESAKEHGLPWPKWLDDYDRRANELQKYISARSRCAGNPLSERNRHDVMWALEGGAIGLGVRYKNWPAGVGVLLGDQELPKELQPPPRLLTISSDVESLKLEGEKFELAFDRDSSNGWAYRHALTKLGYFQDLLLEEKFSEEKAAPSLLEVHRKEEEEKAEKAEREEGEAPEVSETGASEVRAQAEDHHKGRLLADLAMPPRPQPVGQEVGKEVVGRRLRLKDPEGRWLIATVVKFVECLPSANFPNGRRHDLKYEASGEVKWHCLKVVETWELLDEKVAAADEEGAESEDDTPLAARKKKQRCA
jgi:hypothetical protein